MNNKPISVCSCGHEEKDHAISDRCYNGGYDGDCLCKNFTPTAPKEENKECICNGITRNPKCPFHGGNVKLVLEIGR